MLGCRLCSLHTSATGLCSACCRICSLNSLSNLLFVVMVLPPSNTRLQKLISLRTNRGAVQSLTSISHDLTVTLCFVRSWLSLVKSFVLIIKVFFDILIWGIVASALFLSYVYLALFDLSM